MQFSFRRFPWQHFVVALLVVCASCTFAPVPLSEEARAKAYFEEVAKVINNSPDFNEARQEKYKQAFANLTSDFETAAAEVSAMTDEDLTSYLGIQRKLTTIEPPKKLEAYHSVLCETWLSKITIVQRLSTALRKKDQNALRIGAKDVIETQERDTERMQAALRSAGFSSIEDIVDTVEMPGQPLAWYWASIILFIGFGLVIGVLQIAFAVVSLPCIPLLLGATLLWERRQFIGSVILWVALISLVAFGSSCVGTAIASLAENIMWPRSQLAPWFVYFVSAWTCLGFFVPDARDRDGSSSPYSGLVSLGLGVCCLGGFLYVALARGYLVGPWLWIHNIL